MTAGRHQVFAAGRIELSRGRTVTRRACRGPAGGKFALRLVIGALLGITVLPLGAMSYPARPVLAPDSFWYTPIPANAPLNPNSTAYVAEFLRQFQTYYNDVGVNLTSYSTPVYTVGRLVKTVPVQQWNCQNYLDPALQQQWAAVPMPSYAQPAGGSDAEMTIFQPSSDTMWEFWQARKTAGQWQACWGGQMKQVSKNPGDMAATLWCIRHRSALCPGSGHGRGAEEGRHSSCHRYCPGRCRRVVYLFLAGKPIRRFQSAKRTQPHSRGASFPA